MCTLSPYWISIKCYAVNTYKEVYIYIKLIDTQDIIRVCKFKETIAM